MGQFTFIYEDEQGDCNLLVEASYHTYSADYGYEGSEHTSVDVTIEKVNFGKYNLLDGLPDELFHKIYNYACDEVDNHL